MRFRPEQHLRRQSDFRAVREKGLRFHCGAFTFWCFRRETSPDVEADPLRRAGFVASTAAVGHAVLRNRAKRRLRDIFRRHQQSVPAGCDILLSAKAHAIDAPLAEMEAKFLEACRKAGAGR